MRVKTKQVAVPVSQYLPKSYLPALDGLRALALILVFAHHVMPAVYSSTFIWWGWTGVDLFFVLSGFLITGILFDTRQKANYFKDFYVRRALRIFPAYYSVWILLLLAAWLFHGELDRYNLSYLYYGGNMMIPFSEFHHGAISVVPLHVHGDRILLEIAPFWSLCVEQQFYLLWPLVIWLLPSRRILLWTCGVAAVAILALRIFLFLHCSPEWLQTNFMYCAFYTRADTLFIGSFVALWLRGSSRLTQSQYRVRYAALCLGSGLVFLALHLTIGRRWPVSPLHPLVTTVDWTLIALWYAGLLLAALERNLWQQVLRQPWLTSIGRVSYGMYLIHYMAGPYYNPLATSLQPLHRYHLHLAVFLPLVVFLCVYALALLSYRFIEKPCLRLKDRLAPTHGVEAQIELPGALEPDSA